MGTGRVVLITGCSSGFGSAAALLCARRGERVVATVRSLADGAHLLGAAEEESLDLELVELELTDPASCERAVAMTLERAGRIDALVNNAGRVLYAAIEESSEEEVAALFDVNVFGPLRLLQSVLPVMRSQGSGSVVNVSSVNAIVNLPFSGVYGATKWALEAISQTLWLELAPYGIRVAVIEPAGFDTAIADKALPAALPHEGSPYWEGTVQARAASRAANEAAPDLDPVAEAIHEAAFGTERRFRYPVGPHAEMLTELTRRLDDIDLLDALGSGVRTAMASLDDDTTG